MECSVTDVCVGTQRSDRNRLKRLGSGERPITKYNKMVELVLFLSDRSAEVFLKGCEVEGARGGFFGPGNP